MYGKYILCTKGHRIKSQVAKTFAGSICEYICFVSWLWNLALLMRQLRAWNQTSSKAGGVQEQVDRMLLVDWKILRRKASSSLPLELYWSIKIVSSEHSTFQVKLPNQSGPMQSLDMLLLLLSNQSIIIIVFIF